MKQSGADYASAPARLHLNNPHPIGLNPFAALQYLCSICLLHSRRSRAQRFSQARHCSRKCTLAAFAVVDGAPAVVNAHAAAVDALLSMRLSRTVGDRPRSILGLHPCRSQLPTAPHTPQPTHKKTQCTAHAHQQTPRPALAGLRCR